LILEKSYLTYYARENIEMQFIALGVMSCFQKFHSLESFGALLLIIVFRQGTTHKGFSIGKGYQAQIKVIRASSQQYTCFVR